MNYPYIVVLKRNGERYVDSISILLCITSAIAFSYRQIAYHEFLIAFTIVAAALVFGVLINMQLARRKNKVVRYRFLLLTAGIAWIAMPSFQWLCIPFFILSFLEYQAKYPLEVGFTDDYVVINSLIKKKYPWSDFNNVMLKDGLLTLDFKNNRLVQKEAVEDDGPDADEDEFNAFCRRVIPHAPE